MYKIFKNQYFYNIKCRFSYFSPNRIVTVLLSLWFFCLWSWVLFTDTLDLANSKIQGLSVALIVLTVNVSISVLIMKQTFKLINRCFSRYHSGISLFMAWLIFSFADFLVAWIPAIFWLGSQGRLDSILPISTPALLLVNTPLVFASRFIGFFGLAGFFWLFAYLLWVKKLRRLLVFPTLVILILSLSGWLIWKTPNGSLLNATVISEYLTNHIRPIKDQDTDLVVFPEYGLIDSSIDSPINRLSHLQNKVNFIGSQQLVQYDKGGSYNQLLYGNNKDGITRTQNKYRLIPTGEDMPYFLNTLLSVTGHTATLEYFKDQKSTLRGSQQLQPFYISSNNIVGAAVCSSIISPEDYRSFSQNGATVFTNSASLTIFKNSPLFTWQQKSFAKFMAVSNSRYFLQSANSANAYILDNNGRTIVQINDRKIATRSIYNNSRKTIYTITGDFTVIMGGLITVLLLLKWQFTNVAVRHKQKKKARNKT